MPVNGSVRSSAWDGGLLMARTAASLVEIDGGRGHLRSASHPHEHRRFCNSGAHMASRGIPNRWLGILEIKKVLQAPVNRAFGGSQESRMRRIQVARFGSSRGPHFFLPPSKPFNNP